MRTNDRNIRVLAVYTMLLNADSLISVKAIKNRIEKDYNIKTSIKTIYYDIETIRLAEYRDAILPELMSGKIEV